MSFLKFQPQQIFTGSTFLDPGHVLITSHAGVIDGIVPSADAGDDIQYKDGVLLPGFINAHCHLELSHLKGLIPKHTGLVDFVFKVVSQRHFPEGQIKEAIRVAEDEMFDNGIVAVGDICNNDITISQKQKARIAYYNFVELSGWNPQVAASRFEKSKFFYEEFLSFFTHSSIVPHAPYSVSAGLWEMMRESFAGKTISMHNQETAFEDELFLSGEGDFKRMYELMHIDNSHFSPTGMSGLQSVFPQMKSAAHILLVHNTFTTPADIRFVQQQQLPHSWCICINANLYIEKAVPPIDALREAGANIVVGTDSLASNHKLDILNELKSIQSHFPSVPLNELLQWATLNGARALGMDDRYGSFENGKQPGILLLKDIVQGRDLSGSMLQRLL